MIDIVNSIFFLSRYFKFLTFEAVDEAPDTVDVSGAVISRAIKLRNYDKDANSIILFVVELEQTFLCIIM